MKILIAERFIPHSGTVQAFLIACYAVWIFGKLEDKKTHNQYRPRIWLIFSLVFFGQLFLGLIGLWDIMGFSKFDKFLMTGELHFPVPAFIVFEAIFRGSLGFMVGLVLFAVLLGGSAWCSHLCYFGAFDNWAGRKNPVKDLSEKLKKITSVSRYFILGLGAGLAFVLAYMQYPFWVCLFFLGRM